MSLDTTVQRSRRALLTAAAGAAAASAAAALSRPLQVMAASGDPMIVGQVNASLVDHTRLDGTLDVINIDSNGRAITAQDVSVIGSEGAGVEGSSTNGTGLLGTSKAPPGTTAPASRAYPRRSGASALPPLLSMRAPRCTPKARSGSPPEADGRLSWRARHPSTSTCAKKEA